MRGVNGTLGLRATAAVVFYPPRRNCQRVSKRHVAERRKVEGMENKGIKEVGEEGAYSAKQDGIGHGACATLEDNEGRPLLGWGTAKGLL